MSLEDAGVRFLLVILGSGFLGGIATALIVIINFCDGADTSEDGAKGGESFLKRHMTLISRVIFVGMHGVIGVAGAFGFVFLAMSAGKLSFDTATSHNLFMLAGYCVVGGAIGHRVLLKLGVKVEAELFREQIRSAKEQITAVAKKTEANHEYSAVIATMETALGSSSPIDAATAIDKGRTLLGKFRRDRTLNIYLGRLYRRVGD